MEESKTQQIETTTGEQPTPWMLICASEWFTRQGTRSRVVVNQTKVRPGETQTGWPRIVEWACHIEIETNSGGLARIWGEYNQYFPEVMRVFSERTESEYLRSDEYRDTCLRGQS